MVPLAEEGLGAGGAVGGLAEDAAQRASVHELQALQPLRPGMDEPSLLQDRGKRREG